MGFKDVVIGLFLWVFITLRYWRNPTILAASISALIVTTIILLVIFIILNKIDYMITTIVEAM